MPFQTPNYPTPQADGNVPLLPGRARYPILSGEPTWIYHTMGSGSALDGEAPSNGTYTAAEFDPLISPNRADFGDPDVNGYLTTGGLFTLLYNIGRPFHVEDILNPGSATLTIVDGNGNLLRAMPTELPFDVSAGECLMATGGATGTGDPSTNTAYVAFQVRAFGVKIYE